MYVKTRWWFQICLWCSPLLFVEDLHFASLLFQVSGSTTVLIPEDYIRVLSHAAARGAMANYALHERLRQLQCFLARNNRLVLDQETHAALAKLGLCCWNWDAQMKLGFHLSDCGLGWVFGRRPIKKHQTIFTQNALFLEKADRSLHIILDTLHFIALEI